VSQVQQVQSEVMRFMLRRLPDDGRVVFPGSQPVSLARANLHMLRDRRNSYMVC
jgi:hypothetical protein